MKKKTKNIIALMKDELDGKIMKELVGLSTKTYSYLIDDGGGDKKGKCTKKCAIKTKLKFEKHENFLEAAPLKNKINHLEKNKTDVHSLKKYHKEFRKNNKLMLKDSKDFKLKGIILLLKKLIRLL